MNTSVNTDDVIFNFFKQICDEKDDQKCVELGNEWIKDKGNGNQFIRNGEKSKRG